MDSCRFITAIFADKILHNLCLCVYLVGEKLLVSASKSAYNIYICRCVCVNAHRTLCLFVLHAILFYSSVLYRIFDCVGIMWMQARTIKVCFHCPLADGESDSTFYFVLFLKKKQSNNRYRLTKQG